MIPWWLFLAQAFTVIVLVRIFSRRHSRRWQELADAMREELDGILPLVKEFEKRAESAEHLAKVHLEANASFERQRDEAWARYHAAGIGASNAQAMLLKSLEGAVRELNKYRTDAGLEPVQVNEGLRDIVTEFKREHGQ